MILRVYRYRLPADQDPAGMLGAAMKMAELVRKHNKSVHEVKMWVEPNRKYDSVDDTLVIELTMKGHDQWAIKKKVIYPLAAILAKAGVKMKDVHLEAVERVEDKRSTRERASDGRSNPLPEDAMIDHSDMMHP